MASTNGSDDEKSPLIQDRSANHDSVAILSSTSSFVRDAAHFSGRYHKLLATMCILLTELCERLTFYGLTANLVLLCKDQLALPSPLPSTITLVFIGTCYFAPLLGGWLADTHMGRYNTIFGSSLLYTIGALLMLAVSKDDVSYNRTAKLVYFAIALITIAFGTGGIKANVSPFGADQVQQDGPKAVQRFFNWFYFFINLGSLIACSVVVWVQQTEGIFYGYVITAGSIILTVIIFVASRNLYLHKPPGGSQLAVTANIIYEAVKKGRTPNAPMWLDKAKRSFGGTYTDDQVEDVKTLKGIIPIFILIIAYWTIYNQMQTTFLIQGTYMRLEFSSFTVPAASLSVFDIVAVLLLIPIMDNIIYPLLRYSGIRFTPLRRIGVGMLLAVASMVVAGLVEIKRRHTWEQGHVYDQVVNGRHLSASYLNIFWQIPQFMLVGASEVLANITGLEFAYSQSPKHMKGVVMGCYMITSGLGSYITSLLVVIVRSASNDVWYPSKDINQGKLENFFFLLALLMMVAFVIFLFVARSYEYKTPTRRRGKTETENDLWVDTDQQTNPA